LEQRKSEPSGFLGRVTSHNRVSLAVFEGSISAPKKQAGLGGRRKIGEEVSGRDNIREAYGNKESRS